METNKQRKNIPRSLITIEKRIKNTTTLRKQHEITATQCYLKRGMFLSENMMHF
jgi:hypothetical protein